MLAVDLGGTSMRVARAEAGGVLSHRREVPTPPTPGAAPLVALMEEVLAAGAVDAAVVGVPGRVDYGAGRLEHAPNLPLEWRDELCEEALRSRIGLEAEEPGIEHEVGDVAAARRVVPAPDGGHPGWVVPRRDHVFPLPPAGCGDVVPVPGPPAWPFAAHR